MKLNKQIQVKKIFNGYVSVRDYIVKQARENLVGIDIYYKSKVMSLSLKDLDQGIISPKVYKSSYNSVEYMLVDYKWNPEWGKDEKVKKDIKKSSMEQAIQKSL